MAASSGATETVELLIERGANITAKNVGMKTILHSAVGHNNAINAILKVRLKLVRCYLDWNYKLHVL